MELQNPLHYQYYDFSEPWKQNKTPLVLIHGLGATMEIWFPQIPDFARHFPVIAIDLPGCGKSPEIKGELTIQSVTKAVYQQIRAITPDPVNLLGISLGGIVALEYSAAYPQSVQNLILLSTPYTFPNEIKPLLRKNIQDYQSMTMHEISSTRINKAFGKLASQEMINFLVENIQRTKHSVYLQYAQAPIETEFTLNYSKVKAKTLIISGELDYIATPEDSKKIQKLIPGSKVAVLKDTGHALSLENPREMNREVLEFLAARPF